jgi:phosphate transport system permease protein
MTTVVRRHSGPVAEPPRRILSPWRVTETYALLGALAASTAFTVILFSQLTALTGVLGCVVVAWVSFLAFYAVALSFDEDGPAVRDRLAGALVHSVAAVVIGALVLLVGFTFARGLSPLHHLNFFSQDMQAAGPLQPITVGGIKHAAIGTLEQIGLALAITVPLGLTCAVFLNELSGAFSRFVRTIVEAMTALPSVICGLFIYATWILAFGFGKSGFAASLALGLEMLPVIIRASDIVIRLVPGSLREASYALGTSHWRTVWHVVIPTSRSGLTTAVILGTARGIGEAAPVLLTAGFTAGINANPFSGPQVSLPLAAFQFVKSPQPAFIARGFGAAATLLLVVLVLFTVARLVGGRAPGDLTARQSKKRAVASAVDAKRFVHRTSRLETT